MRAGGAASPSSGLAWASAASRPSKTAKVSTPAVGRRNGLTVEGRLLDSSGGGRDLRIPHPGLALGVELGGVEPIEQLAEEIGVFLAHT